jgi:hypothetical protein
LDRHRDLGVRFRRRKALEELPSLVDKSLQASLAPGPRIKFRSLALMVIGIGVIVLLRTRRAIERNDMVAHNDLTPA